MTLITEDKKPRMIELIPSEIDLIIESLKYQPYNIAEFYGSTFISLLDKLEEARL